MITRSDPIFPLSYYPFSNNKLRKAGHYTLTINGYRPQGVNIYLPLINDYRQKEKAVS